MCSTKFREDETLEDEKDSDESKIISEEKTPPYVLREIDFEIFCHKVLQRCLFLLIFVKGNAFFKFNFVVLYAIFLGLKLELAPIETDSDEDISDKPYVEFYKTHRDPTLNDLRRMCSLCLNFVINDNQDKTAYNVRLVIFYSFH